MCIDKGIRETDGIFDIMSLNSEVNTGRLTRKSVSTLGNVYSGNMRFEGLGTKKSGDIKLHCLRSKCSAGVLGRNRRRNQRSWHFSSFWVAVKSRRRSWESVSGVWAGSRRRMALVAGVRDRSQSRIARMAGVGIGSRSRKTKTWESESGVRVK